MDRVGIGLARVGIAQGCGGEGRGAVCAGLDVAKLGRAVCVLARGGGREPKGQALLGRLAVDRCLKAQLELARCLIIAVSEQSRGSVRVAGVLDHGRLEALVLVLQDGHLDVLVGGQSPAKAKTGVLLVNDVLVEAGLSVGDRRKAGGVAGLDAVEGLAGRVDVDAIAHLEAKRLVGDERGVALDLLGHRDGGRHGGDRCIGRDDARAVGRNLVALGRVVVLGGGNGAVGPHGELELVEVEGVALGRRGLPQGVDGGAVGLEKAGQGGRAVVARGEGLGRGAVGKAAGELEGGARKRIAVLICLSHREGRALARDGDRRAVDGKAGRDGLALDLKAAVGGHGEGEALGSLLVARRGLGLGKGIGVARNKLGGEGRGAVGAGGQGLGVGRAVGEGGALGRGHRKLGTRELGLSVVGKLGDGEAGCLVGHDDGCGIGVDGEGSGLLANNLKLAVGIHRELKLVGAKLVARRGLGLFEGIGVAGDQLARVEIRKAILVDRELLGQSPRGKLARELELGAGKRHARLVGLDRIEGARGLVLQRDGRAVHGEGGGLLANNFDRAVVAHLDGKLGGREHVAIGGHGLFDHVLVAHRNHARQANRAVVAGDEGLLAAGAVGKRGARGRGHGELGALEGDVFVGLLERQAHRVVGHGAAVLGGSHIVTANGDLLGDLAAGGRIARGLGDLGKAVGAPGKAAGRDGAVGGGGQVGLALDVGPAAVAGLGLQLEHRTGDAPAGLVDLLHGGGAGQALVDHALVVDDGLVNVGGVQARTVGGVAQVAILARVVVVDHKVQGLEAVLAHVVARVGNLGQGVGALLKALEPHLAVLVGHKLLGGYVLIGARGLVLELELGAADDVKRIGGHIGQGQVHRRREELVVHSHVLSRRLLRGVPVCVDAKRGLGLAARRNHQVGLVARLYKVVVTHRQAVTELAVARAQARIVLVGDV